MLLPFCIIDYILKIGGAYSWDEKVRPYIAELHEVHNILPERGVRASIVHLKEMYALKRAYVNHNANPLRGVYPDAWHLL